jgi:hypothetical protein
MGPGCKRITASLPAQLLVELPFPVVTNRFLPSLATPPIDHAPALVIIVAQFIMLPGLLICTPTSRP